MLIFGTSINDNAVLKVDTPIPRVVVLSYAIIRKLVRLLVMHDRPNN